MSTVPKSLKNLKTLYVFIYLFTPKYVAFLVELEKIKKPNDLKHAQGHTLFIVIYLIAVSTILNKGFK